MTKEEWPYGRCGECGGYLQPEFFEEPEIRVSEGRLYRTGRKRMAVSCLVCPDCLKRYCVDESFDGPWY